MFADFQITDRYSGDNYVIMARLGSTGTPMARSGLLTAWKRIYVEFVEVLKNPEKKRVK